VSKELGISRVVLSSMELLQHPVALYRSEFIFQFFLLCATSVKVRVLFIVTHTTCFNLIGYHQVSTMFT
jgi:hypothetical protein